MLRDITTLPLRTVVDGVFFAGGVVVDTDVVLAVVVDGVVTVVDDGVVVMVVDVEAVVAIEDVAGSTYPTPIPISGGTLQESDYVR